MVMIQQESVLSIFTIIRDAIKANTTLSAKFNNTNIHQFEPKHKAGASFKGFPYFWINIPSTDTEKLVFDNSVVPHTFSVGVLLRMDWEARSKVLDYANAFMYAIGEYESTFDDSGYYDVMVHLIDVNPNQVINMKQIVETEFELTFKGKVRRG
jgi:hypothetical protein